MFSWYGFQMFPSSFCYYSGGSSYYRYSHTFHVPHSLYLYTWTLVLIYFLLSFVWHFCPLVLPHLSICMLSPLLFSLLLLLYVAYFPSFNFTVSAYPWFHNTVKSSCSRITSTTITTITTTATNTITNTINTTTAVATSTITTATTTTTTTASTSTSSFLLLLMRYNFASEITVNIYITWRLT